MCFEQQHHGNAPLVEVTPVKWTFLDGIDEVEQNGETTRFVAYVVEGGPEPQRRKVIKAILPTDAVIDAINKLTAAVGHRPLDRAMH